MISPVFKYIFAVVVGGLFIIFFINFAIKSVKEPSEIITAGESVQRFINTLNAFSTAEDSIHPLNLGLETEVIFDCNQIKMNQMSDDSQHIIFAPLILKGRSIDMWTKQFAIENFLPITNFFYLSNQDHQYVLVFDSSSQDYVNNLYNKFPKQCPG